MRIFPRQQTEQPAATTCAATAPPATPWGVLLDDLRIRSERRAWRVAWCACFVALLAVCGIIMLAPYRTVVPYLLAVDRARGDILPIGAVDQRAIKDYQELLDKHWVQRYVVARESYYYRLLQEDYDTVYDLSEDAEREQFTAQYEGPNARDKRYGSDTEIRVRVASVQLASNEVGTQATVRYSTVERRLDNRGAEITRYYIVTLAYRYLPRMFGTELELIRNPLGFKVGPYRVSAELPPSTPGAEPGGKTGGA